MHTGGGLGITAITPSTNDTDKSNTFGDLVSQQRRNTFYEGKSGLGKPPLTHANSVNTSACGGPSINYFVGSLEAYSIGKQIGQGAYASVKLVQHKATQSCYALKVYEKYKLTDPMKKKAVQREIAVLKRVDHPNIIKMFELIDTPK